MSYELERFALLSGITAKQESPREIHISGQASKAATKQFQLKRDFLYGQQPLAGPVPVYVQPVTRWNSEFMRQEKSDNRGFVAQRTSRPVVQSIPSLPSVNSSFKENQFNRSAGKMQPRETKKPALPHIIYSTKGNENCYVA